MRVAVLGSGVIGITSAYYLAKAGHEVIVVDRSGAAGLETSYANAGQISPGYSSPWASPSLPLAAARWLMMKHSPIILRPSFDHAMLRWLVAMLNNCTAERYSRNKERMVRLAEFSRDCLADLRAETKIRYDERTRGTLQLFRTQRQVDGTAKDISVLRAGGVPFEVLDRRGCMAIERGLESSQAPIAGGLLLPNDETGDCFKFTTSLAEKAGKLGVQFLYNTAITSLRLAGGKISGIETSTGDVIADVYLVALGSYTPVLLAPIGIQVPIYPVKGYSLTFPIAVEERAPQSTVMDETYKIAITRLGNRIRVGGMAEIAGYSLALPDSRRRTLMHSVNSLFPDAGDLRTAKFWTGLRPMTPDGTPIIGPTKFGNLFLNSGHGTLGWTMACGSGHVIADIISGRSPEIKTTDLSIARYSNLETVNSLA